MKRGCTFVQLPFVKATPSLNRHSCQELSSPTSLFISHIVRFSTLRFSGFIKNLSLQTRFYGVAYLCSFPYCHL